MVWWKWWLKRTSDAAEQAAETAAPVFRNLDRRDRDSQFDELLSQQRDWIPRLLALLGDEANSKVQGDYLGSLAVGVPEFDERRRVLSMRAANANSEGERLNMTFAAIRGWDDVGYLLKFGSVLQRWEAGH